MFGFTDECLRKKLEDGHAEHAAQANSSSFLALRGDLRDRVRDGVNFLKAQPFVLYPEIISGWVYDVDKPGDLPEKVTG